MPGRAEKNSSIGNILFGIVLMAAGVACYFWFAHMEAEGGQIRTHALIILAYRMLGKLGVLGLFGLFGAVFAAIGVKGLIAGKGDGPAKDA